MALFTAGDIVLADWRGDALPKEPNKRRPAVVIEDDALFGSDYPNVILVPLTEDAGLAIQGLAEAIEPSTENGCTKRCFALAPFVACTSAARVTGDPIPGHGGPACPHPATGGRGDRLGVKLSVSGEMPRHPPRRTGSGLFNQPRARVKGSQWRAEVVAAPGQFYTSARSATPLTPSTCAIAYVRSGRFSV
jgi:mRNA interferase MazF